ARGTAFWNVVPLASLFDFDEIRVMSARRESREEFGERLGHALGRDVAVVEPTRLVAPEPILRTSWIPPGAFVVPYGTMSAVELVLLSVMDKVVVDDWEQCKPGGRFGALRAHVDS